LYPFEQNKTKRKLLALSHAAEFVSLQKEQNCLLLFPKKKKKKLSCAVGEAKGA